MIWVGLGDKRVSHSWFYFEGKTFEMFVSDLDYIRILHEGNFISFVCLVLDTDDEKTSTITTEEIRLKVSEGKATHQPFLHWLLCI